MATQLRMHLKKVVQLNVQKIFEIDFRQSTKEAISTVCDVFEELLLEIA